MQFDKLTVKSQEAVQTAQSLATSREHNLIDSLHLLAAMLEQTDGSTQPLLKKLGAPSAAIRQRVEAGLARLPRGSGGGGAELRLGQTASRALEAAFKEAEGLKDEYVSTEHLLLA